MNDAYADCTGKAEEIKAGVNGLFDLPEEHCGCCWNFSGERYPCCSDMLQFFEGVYYDEESEKIRCRKCGSEVIFGVMESY